MVDDVLPAAVEQGPCKRTMLAGREHEYGAMGLARDRGDDCFGHASFAHECGGRARSLTLLAASNESMSFAMAVAFSASSVVVTGSITCSSVSGTPACRASATDHGKPICISSG